MTFDSPSVQQLSTVIYQVTGPAFLLAAEAQLLSVLVTRLDRIVDRSHLLDRLDDAEDRTQLREELPILEKRARLMHRAIYWGVASCIVTSILVILSFITAFLRMRHEYGAGAMFALAMALFTAALVFFGREVRLSAFEVDRTTLILQKRVGKSCPRA
ncbi:DUF2721 domain-containing protein [Methylocystis echinoides]|uniref:DUF2721 domain-containing protein n=1 Tax=Methylocystis echinoides TaxID=29468 RepID=A0A9W6GRE3_9HYPH|nr:DUF2721 domain-containing protein [Methylocystis echinoides]GLI91663.1 hypothetical protein LMG27198_06550 [Methylocystis echinoides]